MFKIVHCTCGIRIYECSEVNVWGASVRFFDFYNLYDQWLGGFCLDIYSRKNKCSGV